jgi:hypothetical protein
LATWLAVWQSSQTLVRAFREQRECVRNVYELGRHLVRTPDDVPAAYRVSMGPLPDDALAIRRNLFSVLFLSVYHLLDIPPQRRLLFGKLNQLFRVWVTAADNLLDNEDKVVLPLNLPKDARTMREVVAIMAADRILAEILRRAVAEGTITSEESSRVSGRSLQALLGSAGQEASEEAGVEDRPPPEEVLHTIHRLKTGLLFHIPFVGPERALLDFGLGCQLLDDIRDLATDLVERRHNYLLSHLRWHQPEAYGTLIARSDCRPGDRLYQEFPDVADLVAEQGYRLMRESMAAVSERGLALRRDDPARIAKSMFRILDLTELAERVHG